MNKLSQIQNFINKYIDDVTGKTSYKKIIDNYDISELLRNLQLISNDTEILQNFKILENALCITEQFLFILYLEFNY